MSILDDNLDNDINLKEYYSNKIVKFFTTLDLYDTGLIMHYVDGVRMKIHAGSVFCDTPLEYILDRPDIFHLYYLRKHYSQIDIYLVVLDSRNIEMIRKFENAKWQKVTRKVTRKGNGNAYVPVTMEYILNYEPA